MGADPGQVGHERKDKKSAPLSCPSALASPLIEYSSCQKGQGQITSNHKILPSFFRNGFFQSNPLCDMAWSPGHAMRRALNFRDKRLQFAYLFQEFFKWSSSAAMPRHQIQAVPRSISMVSSRCYEAFRLIAAKLLSRFIILKGRILF